MRKGKRQSVAILNHHSNAPDYGGGGRHYQIAKYFSSFDYYVTVLASSYRRSKRTYKGNEEMTETNFGDKLKFVRFKTKPAYKSNIGRFLNYIDYERKASKYDNFDEKPDTIIASSVHPLAWVAGYKLAQKYGAKFIVEVRDLWPLSMYEDFSGLTRKIVFSYFESLEKKYYNLADAIITTAPYAYEYMEDKYRIDKNKVYHIPHGIDLKKFDKDGRLGDEVLDKELLKILENNFCVTYTGSLSKSEGLPTFVQSARYLKDKADIKLVIIGNGNEKNKLQSIIKNEHLDNVIMIEGQPRKTMALTLKKSKILFCGLMEREAFKYGISKNKFYDYMAAEKPIIFASSVRGSLITKANAGITIEPNQPERLASAIKSIYKNINTLGKEYAKNGRNYVEKYHTNEVVAEKFLDVIHATNN